MFDSLPYRNDAASVFGRLIRSLPTRSGVIGVATCDKGLPAMMMALAGARDLPARPRPRRRHAARRRGRGRRQDPDRRARASPTDRSRSQDAAEGLCRACASPGGGCQFLGTAATSQVVGEALGMSLHALRARALGPPHLARHGAPVRARRARARSRAALAHARHPHARMPLRNAMVVHAAFGGSTNLILHLPAIAHSAGLTRPTVDDWTRVNRQTPRLVDALPNGPKGHPTVQVFLAGGVPEVMLHLRRAGLLETERARPSAAKRSATRSIGGSSPSAARRSARVLRERDGVDPDDVIMDPDGARRRGLTSTVTFPQGNLAPGGIGHQEHGDRPERGRAPTASIARPDPRASSAPKTAAIAAIKSGGIRAGDVLVLMCRGPMGSGMEEIYQITSALRYLDFGKHVAVITDARFSGVSTGACIGHVTPEALAGGPLGKVREGDLIEIVDRPRAPRRHR